MAAKKRLTMFDAMDGALSKIHGLADAAEKAKTLPFKLRTEPSAKETTPASNKPEEQAPATDFPRRERETTRAASVEQTHQTDRPDSSKRQTDQTVRTDRSTRQSGQTVQADRQTDRTDQSDRPNEQTDETDVSDRLTRQSYQSDRSDNPTASRIKLAPKNPMVTPGQKAVFRYFQINGSHVTTYEIISNETRVPRGTVRAIIRKMEALGLLKKKDWWDGNTRAIDFIFLGDRPITGLSDQTDRSDSPTRQSHQTERPAPYMKIDRKKNLSISLEVIQTTWPHLARCGFGVEQLTQIMENLTATGQTTERVLPSLHHAEWELANAAMRDKNGTPVADPCSWVFRSLAQTGYYRRPKGYVSPEEQAARDAEEEAKAIVAARQAADAAQFEAWQAGLSDEALREAMQGCPGGPKEAWLRKVWRERKAKG